MKPRAGPWLRQVAAMIGKEWRQLIRDRALFGFIIFIFTLDIVLAAGAPSAELRQTRIGVIDRDASQASRDLIYRLRPPYFEVLMLPDDNVRVTRRLDRGELLAVLTIPQGFEQALVTGRPASAQLVVDATNVNLGYLVSSYTERIVAEQGAEFVSRPSAGGALPAPFPAVRLQARSRFNPTLAESWYSTLSELISMLTVASIVLPAAALVREKERGTIEQLLVSPLSPLQIVLAKVVAMTVVVLAGSLVAVGPVMHRLLGVPFAGNPLLFFALVVLYAMTASGLGIVISTFARNSGQVGLIVLMLLMPMILLSGTWNLRESMPVGLQVALSFLPLRHFVDIGYAVLLKGAGVAVIAAPAARMTLLGIVFFTVGVARFRRQLK